MSAYQPIIDWDDPAERGRLIERIGPAAYNAEQLRHRRATSVFENGHAIRPIVSQRWGQLHWLDAASAGYQTLEQARTKARSLPAGPGPE